MKKIVICGIVIILFCVSCDFSYEYFKSANTNFENGNYNESLLDLKKVKSGNNYNLKQKASELEKRILDTLIIIDYQKMKKDRRDNIYMGFCFGMSKKKVYQHAQKLIRENKINKKCTYTLTIGFGEYAKKVNLTGYEVDFFISDYKCTGLIEQDYFLDKLDRLSIILIRYPELKSGNVVLLDLKRMYYSKYGTAQQFTPYYTDEEGKYIEHFWKDSNKGISISKISGYITISYEDLIARIDKSNLKQSLQENEKKINKQKSQELKNNI